MSDTNESFKQWEKAWRVIAAALKEMGVSEIDHNAKAILARLSHEDMIVVSSKDLKD